MNCELKLELRNLKQRIEGTPTAAFVLPLIEKLQRMPIPADLDASSTTIMKALREPHGDVKADVREYEEEKTIRGKQEAFNSLVQTLEEVFQRAETTSELQ